MLQKTEKKNPGGFEPRFSQTEKNERGRRVELMNYSERNKGRGNEGQGENNIHRRWCPKTPIEPK